MAALSPTHSPGVARRPPGQLGGRGLLLVNHVADLVRLRSDPTGTTVQTFMLL
jgi:anti-sigma regulatory factor (Ser/Thr protein kinase)